MSSEECQICGGILSIELHFYNPAALNYKIKFLAQFGIRYLRDHVEVESVEKTSICWN